MGSIVTLISDILGIYTWILIAAVILSLLIHFNVVNSRNQLVFTLWTIFSRMTEPVLAPIRRFLPDLGPIDISPILLILLISFARNFMCETLGPCGYRF